MKNIYIFLILVIPFIYFNQPLYSDELPFNGDLKFENNTSYTATVKMKIVSVPFEGLTNIDSSEIPNNRFNQIQNGIVWRYWDNGVLNREEKIHYLFGQCDSCDLIDLGHVSGVEFPNSSITGAWGFAKYLITFEILETGELYKCYLNSLDSDYGRDNIEGLPIYGSDFVFKYEPGLSQNKRLIFYRIFNGNQPIDTISVGDTLANGKPSKEFKVWEIILDRENPRNKHFFAKSTPFPVNDTIARFFSIREFIIGTKVTFNGVYENTGSNDRYGYNTVNYPYFFNSPAIIPFNRQGLTYITPGQFNTHFEEFGIKIIAEAGDTMIFADSVWFWIYGSGTSFGDTLLLKSNSTVILGEGAEIFTHSGGTLINEGADIQWGDASCHRAFTGTSINYSGQNHIVENGGFIVIDGGAKLKLSDSTILTFDGADSYLKLKPNSDVELGSNSKIIFKNGAYLDADSTNFSCSTSWQGIVLENAGSQTEIKNCTFNNAPTSISILNTSTGAYLNKFIKDNIFNVPSGGIGVYAENAFRIFLHGNKFNMTSNSGKGLHLLNTIVPTSEGSYDLKMIGNEFTGGQVQAALIAQTTEYLPIYFYGNKFFGTALYNIVGRKLVGNIKQNTNLTSTSTTGFHFTQSIPLLYNNKLSTSGNSIYLGSNSFPRMAPVIDPYADFLWYGGRNQLSSSGMDNIHIQSGYPITDYGTNSFTISSTQNFHIEGYLPDSTGAWYYTRNNCWYGNSGMPWTNLKKLDSIPVPPLYQNPNYNCNYTYTEDTPVIDDLGDGIYDTVIVTETNTSDTIALDEVSYGQAAFYHEESNYSMAIIEYRSLIDSFPGSSYINAVPDLLYDCYSSLDTSGSQDATDSLFSDLKLYMENKINSAQYDKTFNDECYDVILMCEAMMENYYDALTGYEFISLYHPDPETRLLASMDYSDIEDLLGEGGGFNNKPVNIENRKKALDRLSDRDPVMKIIKKGYEKQTKDLDKRQTKEDKIKRVRVNSEVDMNVRRNLYSSRNLTKEEKRIRNDENILVLLSIGEVMTGRKDEIINIIPNSYKLEQNYPNPFNPTTTINYSIPKDGLVSIKVYDITGREIRTLVNEIKVTGNYSIVFNGSNLSSGVYFYKIEAGNFVHTKRMVLVK